ncbi:MAG: CYTH domain-containing protein [Lachnospiraceae bacterium]|nr:CYTH domain-containing protein [Candidatus Equihabitans merdae]
MEIERKYLITNPPADLESYPCEIIEQGYLNTNPVVRVRRLNDEYILTYKGKGLLAREEYNLPLTAEAYAHLIQKSDGYIISKKRYLIPLENDLTIELDRFVSPRQGLLMAEVEFPTEEAANAFVPPAWFGEEVTFDPNYHNSTMSRLG